MAFNPYLHVPEEKAMDGGGASYTLVSYGVRHIKFWSLHTEKGEGDWRHNWKLEGSLAVTGRSSDDFTSVAFLFDGPGDISLGTPPRARVVAGTSSGAITVWGQLEDVIGEQGIMETGAVRSTPLASLKSRSDRRAQGGFRFKSGWPIRWRCMVILSSVFLIAGDIENSTFTPSLYLGLLSPKINEGQSAEHPLAVTREAHGVA